MSDKPKRTVKEIQQEYTNLAYQAGQVQYQIWVFENDLKALNDRLRDLNFEGAEASKGEQDIQAKLEAVSS